MMGELIAELAALASSQGWEIVGLYTEDNGRKTIAIHNRSGEGLQVCVTPGRVQLRQQS